MQIRMLSTHRGSEDGFKLRRYFEGCVYDVADTMGSHFLCMGWAEPTDTRTAQVRVEEFMKQLQEVRA